MQINYVSVMFLITDVATIAVTTFYRFKFLSVRNVVKNFFKNLNYVDEYLNSVGFEVDYIKDFIVCSVFTIITAVHQVVMTYFALHNMISEHQDSNIASEFASILNLSAKVVLFISFATLELYVIVCLFILKLRITRLRNTVRNLIVDTNSVRSACCTRIYVAYREGAGVYLKLNLIYNAVLKTAWATEGFYNFFLFRNVVINFVAIFGRAEFFCIHS